MRRAMPGNGGKRPHCGAGCGPSFRTSHPTGTRPARPAAVDGLRSAEQRLVKASSAPEKLTASMQTAQAVADGEYRCPTDLLVSETPLKRVMVIGSCLTEGWPPALQRKYPDCVADHFLVNNAAMLPEAPPCAPEEYDFHLIQIPLRQILPEHLHFALPYSDPAAFEQLFETARSRVSDRLAELMRCKMAPGIFALVCHVLVPQHN